MILHKRKILFVLESPILGGAERQALGLAEYLSNERSCVIDLLVTKSQNIPEPFRNYCKSYIRHIYSYDEIYLYLPLNLNVKNFRRISWSLKTLNRLRKQLKNSEYFMVIPFLNEPSKIAFFLYHLIKSIKVTFWHQLGLDTWKNDFFEKIAIYFSPFVIANADNCLTIFREQFRLDEKKLYILPQFVSLKRTTYDKVDIRNKYNLALDRVLFGMIAHFREEKLHFKVIEAFKLLLNSGYSAQLVFLGDKRNTKATKKKYYDLKNYIRHNNLSDNIKVLTNQSVEQILSSLDVGVLISEIEGTPNVVQEYMLYGLPVISTNHPGCITLMGESQFLIENDVNALYDKMKLLCDSPELRKKSGDLNENLIKKFNPKSYIRQLEKIIADHL